MANTLKNKKKAEKKKRALDRRMIESNSSTLEMDPATVQNMSGSSSLDLSITRKGWRKEENLIIIVGLEEGKNKTKNMTQRRNKKFG